jgi:cell division protein FtsI/penicillin-binding protein 2/cell division protein FtsW (lipid II flippase)
MAVTKSKAVERSAPRPGSFGGRAGSFAGWRRAEFLWMLGASALIAAGLYLVYQSRGPALAAAPAPLNLNALSAREDLLPVLTPVFPDTALRNFAAEKIYYASGSLSNVGALARLRIRADELAANNLRVLRERLAGRASEPLLTADQFRLLKPQLSVRTPDRFRRSFLLWAGLFFAFFFAAHIFLSIRGFTGDQSLLPATLLLSGIGLILMVSLRDPLRDNLLFAEFAQGAVIGCAMLAGLATLDFKRLFGHLSFVPLIASFVLSVLLILFGSGPGTSDAKVNLLGFQPVELIRLLLVFFLAGYFANSWDVLRHAREGRAKLAVLTSRFDLPPVEFILPVAVCVGLSVVFFFLQKDMGPALVFACLFLALYGIARGSAFVPAIGIALVSVGFFAGYLLGVPHTVGERVSMFLSPWNNLVLGGDQLADSLWGYATGGATGMGIGLGDPEIVPAAHTDLILSALGEEWGFLGIAAVFALYALVVYRSFRIAMRARSDYEFFLGIGLAAVTALQILLISAGSLGVFPLSGVVTPFLSFGRTSMLANFAVIAILLAISATPSSDARPLTPVAAQSKRQALTLGFILAAAAVVVLGKAAYVQVLHSDAIVGEGTLVIQADGARRYQYNPRFQLVMREIPMGSVYDRNGLPLATSDWAELEKHRAEYQQLGVDIDRACPRTETRHYPFGGLLFDLLGDIRTRTRWGATNTLFIERDSARRLRGYDDRPTLVEVKNPKTHEQERVLRYDYRELVPLLRHRYDPQNAAVRKILDRARNIKTSIDARLQVQVAAILRKQLQQSSRDKGAAVVMDSATGDTLAAVSFPLPGLLPGNSPADNQTQDSEANPYLDRARIGLYPPGSTFKIVTAMAALRKDPSLAHKTYECIRLPDGRAGNFIKGSNRPIRDDVEDKNPHGTVDMEHGIVVSCNAYFAQLGDYDVGAQSLFDTASLLGIAAATPATAAQLKKTLPQSSYGQGQVVASPFQMARVAATVANGGMMPEGRWVTDETNTRTNPPQAVIAADQAQMLAKFMREVVTSGTGRRAAASSVPMAGKTGTAELQDADSHAWFIGFAPYGAAASPAKSAAPATASEPHKIAFSVLIENGVYGGTAAAPAAAEIVNAAAKLGLLQ